MIKLLKYLQRKSLPGQFVLLITIATICLSCAKAVTSKPDQAPPPGSKEEGTDPPAMEWKQKEFVLSTFFALPGSGNATEYRRILTKTKAAGLDLVELPFISAAALDVAVRVAEEVGIKVLAQDHSVFSGIGKESPVFKEQDVINRINSLKRFNILEGYYVWDEPFEVDFGKVKQLNDVFRKNDPGRLPFSVIFPSYGVYNWESGAYNWDDNSYTRYVNNFLDQVDPVVLSFNYYPYRTNTAEANLITNDLWKDFGYIRKKALERNKNLWYYFQAVSLLPDVESIINLERIRAQMYGALAYGVKGLSYYNTHGSLLDANGEETAIYNDLLQLNKEVKNVGNFLFNKTSEKLYQTGLNTQNNTAYFLDKISDSDLIASAPDHLIIGVFSDSTSKKYILVTNKSHDTRVTGSIGLKRNIQIGIFDKKINKENDLNETSNSLDVNLLPGEAILYILN